MPRRTAHLALCLAALLLSSACGVLPSGASDDRVQLEFFQFKAEAVATFDRIIADFEAEHPEIDVQQNNVPSPDVAIRTRLVKNDMPDVVALNGNATFGELASAGVFHDFSGDRAAEGVSPAFQQVLDDLGTRNAEEHNGLPFAGNANGVIYNKELFARHNVAVPATWSEVIAAAETFRRAGVTPFYGTLKDAWTAMPAFNTLAANLPPADFFERRAENRTTFGEEYAPVAEKLEQLYSYTQKDTFSRDYNAGNAAFAQGEAAMLLQGSYALPAIKALRPDFEIGTFALPHNDDAAATRLVTGVDVVLTMGRDPAHPRESAEFIEYLMSPEVTARYAQEQSTVPPFSDALPDDPALAGVMPYFREGRLTGYPDHHIPPAVNLNAVTQQFLTDGRQDAYLRTLDDEWNKVQDRRS